MINEKKSTRFLYDIEPGHSSRVVRGIEIITADPITLSSARDFVRKLAEQNKADIRSYINIRFMD
jgi:hypothetical protein